MNRIFPDSSKNFIDSEHFVMIVWMFLSNVRACKDYRQLSETSEDPRGRYEDFSVFGWSLFRTENPDQEISKQRAQYISEYGFHTTFKVSTCLHIFLSFYVRV